MLKGSKTYNKTSKQIKALSYLTTLDINQPAIVPNRAGEVLQVIILCTFIPIMFLWLSKIRTTTQGL